MRGGGHRVPCGDCGQTRDRHVHLQDSWTSARRAAEPVLLSHLAGTWGCGAPCTRDALSAGEGRSHCTRQSLIQFLKPGAGGGAILVLLFVAGGGSCTLAGLRFAQSPSPEIQGDLPTRVALRMWEAQHTLKVLMRLAESKPTSVCVPRMCGHRSPHFCHTTPQRAV